MQKLFSKWYQSLFSRITEVKETMSKTTIEIGIHEEVRISINLTPNTSMVQLLLRERDESENSIDTLQPAVPEMSAQSVVITRTITPLQETNKLASAEVVLPKIR